MEIITGKIAKAQRIVIYAPEGIGKSTLASQAPKPLFMDIESGTGTMDVARLPKPSSWTMLKAQLAELKQDAHGFKTLVIDTADWAERMCLKHICDQAGHVSIEDFGFGKGFVKAKEEWGLFLDYLTELSAAQNIHIVVLAHAHLKKFEQPDENGAYDRYEMKLSKGIAPLTKEWADAVLFINYQTIVVEDENTKSKKAQGGKRVIHTAHHVSWDAKNRHGLPDKIDFAKTGTWEKFGPEFFAIGSTPSSSVTATPTPTPTPTPEPVVADSTLREEIKQDVQAVVAESQIAKVDPTSFPAPLFDLMESNNVTAEEIQQAVGRNGYYTAETPIGNYDEPFVNHLVSVWDQVFESIKSTRK